jgi:hypothetical protein
VGADRSAGTGGRAPEGAGEGSSGGGGGGSLFLTEANSTSDFTLSTSSLGVKALSKTLVKKINKQTLSVIIKAVVILLV